MKKKEGGILRVFVQRQMYLVVIWLELPELVTDKPLKHAGMSFLNYRSASVWEVSRSVHVS